MEKDFLHGAKKQPLLGNTKKKSLAKWRKDCNAFCSVNTVKIKSPSLDLQGKQTFDFDFTETISSLSGGKKGLAVQKRERFVTVRRENTCKVQKQKKLWVCTRGKDKHSNGERNGYSEA